MALGGPLEEILQIRLRLLQLLRVSAPAVPLIVAASALAPAPASNVNRSMPANCVRLPSINTLPLSRLVPAVTTKAASASSETKVKLSLAVIQKSEESEAAARTAAAGRI